MWIWQVLFVLLLAYAFYAINWKVKYPETAKKVFGIPFPQFVVDVFLVGTFILWLLQVVGVGK